MKFKYIYNLNEIKDHIVKKHYFYCTFNDADGYYAEFEEWRAKQYDNYDKKEGLFLNCCIIKSKDLFNEITLNRKDIKKIYTLRAFDAVKTALYKDYYILIP